MVLEQDSSTALKFGLKFRISRLATAFYTASLVTTTLIEISKIVQFKTTAKTMYVFLVTDPTYKSSKYFKYVLTYKINKILRHLNRMPYTDQRKGRNIFH